MVLATFIAACLGQKHESHMIIVPLLLLKWQPLLVTLSGAYYRTSSSLLQWIMHRLLLTTCRSWVQSSCLIMVTFLVLNTVYFFSLSFCTGEWASRFPSGKQASESPVVQQQPQSIRAWKGMEGKKNLQSFCCSYTCQPSISVVYQSLECSMPLMGHIFTSTCPAFQFPPFN